MLALMSIHNHFKDGKSRYQ